MLQIVASLTDKSTFVIYDQLIFYSKGHSRGLGLYCKKIYGRNVRKMDILLGKPVLFAIVSYLHSLEQPLQLTMDPYITNL